MNKKVLFDTDFEQQEAGQVAGVGGFFVLQKAERSVRNAVYYMRYLLTTMCHILHQMDLNAGVHKVFRFL